MLLTLDNPLMRTYVVYAAILSLKMLLMSVLTGLQRFKNKAFANPEDGVSLKVKPKVDDNVERVRRAHLNDLENITVFFVVSFAYIMTNPSVGFATLLFRAFTLARFAHTFVYAICVLPQPSRALAFFFGYGITIYMAIQTVLHFTASL